MKDSSKKPVEGQIVYTRNMGAYIIQHIWKNSHCLAPEERLILMKEAINPNGDYIGRSKFAYHLVKKYGITKFELRTKTSRVCSIGYNPDTKKWYGWSHRAIAGYKGPNAKRSARRFAESVS